LLKTSICDIFILLVSSSHADNNIVNNVQQCYYLYSGQCDLWVALRCLLLQKVDIHCTVYLYHFQNLRKNEVSFWLSCISDYLIAFYYLIHGLYSDIWTVCRTCNYCLHGCDVFTEHVASMNDVICCNLHAIDVICVTF